MTDKTPEQYAEEQYQKAAAALDALLTTIDSKLLFAMFLGYSSGLGSRLLAAKMIPIQEVFNMFAAACADATAPSDKPAPQVFYIDGNEKLGAKH